MNQEVINVEVKRPRGRPKKVPSELERPIEADVEVKPLVSFASDSDRASGAVPPENPQNAPMGSAVPPKPKRTRKGKMLDEVLEQEKAARLEQIQLEAELKRKALEEVKKMEDYKIMLLRDEIKKQLESSAEKEVKKTRRKAAEKVPVSKEQKAATRSIIKELVPVSNRAPAVRVTHPSEVDVAPHSVIPQHRFIQASPAPAAPAVSAVPTYQYPIVPGISRRFGNRTGF